MLLSPQTTVLLLAKLLNFIHSTVLSTGSELKTILVLYDNPSTQLTNDILCSSVLQSLYVSWSTLNVDRTSKIDFKANLPLTLAILQHELSDTLYNTYKSLKFNRYKNKNNIILIYPFEIGDNDTFFAEFEEISEYLPIFFVNIVDNNIKVIFRSMLFDRTIFLNELQLENDIRNLFYRPFDNMQLQPINVIVMIDPPMTFKTITSSENIGSGYLPEGINGIGGIDLYLTQFLAESLNGTAIFHTLALNESEDFGNPEWLRFTVNKQLLPLKAPALPPIKNVNYVSLDEYVRYSLLL